jgi:hypothetical protein
VHDAKPHLLRRGLRRGFRAHHIHRVHLRPISVN